jgi:hypothetical protein
VLVQLPVELGGGAEGAWVPGSKLSSGTGTPYTLCRAIEAYLDINYNIHFLFGPAFTTTPPMPNLSVPTCTHYQTEERNCPFLYRRCCGKTPPFVSIPESNPLAVCQPQMAVKATIDRIGLVWMGRYPRDMVLGYRTVNGFAGTSPHRRLGISSSVLDTRYLRRSWGLLIRVRVNLADREW